MAEPFSSESHPLSGPSFTRFGIWWSGLFALGLAFFIVPVKDESIVPWFTLIAYLALLLAVVYATRRSMDLVNPLVLVLVGGLFRYSVSASIMAARSYDHEGYPLFSAMSLTPESWQLGHALAVVGLVAVVLGWNTQRDESWRLRFETQVGPGYPVIAGAQFIIGVGALWLFVKGNAPSLDLVEGGFRAVDIRVGTGKYFFLALGLISGSVALTAWLFSLGRGWMTSLLPVMVASGAFFLLGGRARAATPLAAGLMILWHRIDDHTHPRSQRRRFIMAGIAIVLLAAWFGNFGALFRGGGGISSFSESLSSTADYLENGALVDFGHLHALAGTSLLEPGVLGIAPISYPLLWPLSDLLGLPGPSPGTYLIRVLTGDPDPGWGLHTGLIGDAYLSFGFVGVLMVAGTFGGGIRYLYRQFQKGRIQVTVHAMVLVYSVRIFLEGIAKWPEALVVTILLVLPSLVGKRVRQEHRMVINK